MASSRFPGKPLAMIHNMPMIGHVYKRSKMSASLCEVYVATCDKEIFDYIGSIGGKAVMTADTHERATDRTAECLLNVEADTGCPVDIVVMIQGDEPMLMPDMIELAVAPLLRDDSIDVVNLMAPLKNRREHEDPNEVKVVVDQHDFALYFSREPIPSRKKGGKDVPMFKQVCIIPFRKKFLLKFNQLTPTPLEVVESVDMLRILEHGYRVKMVRSDYKTYSVDTPFDLKVVVKRMTKDPLIDLYTPVKTT
jgi:3-deoxy-manno-octulosonate cytidylyltransferase (CMP-KDO synthetase)